MTYVKVDPVTQEDGQALTRYYGTATTTSTTYTYKVSQDNVSIRNMGTQDITVTVNSVPTIINQNRLALFTNVTSFSVVSSQGKQDFMAESWASWTASGSTTSSTPSTTSTTSNKFVPVGSKVSNYYNFSAVDANHQTLTYKVRHTANMKCGMIRLVYSNFYSPLNSNNGDADGANDITIGASIEDGSGNVFPVMFNGSKKVTLNIGTSIVSDPVAVFFNQGDVFYTRNYVSVAASAKFPVGVVMEGGTEGIGQGDMTASGSVTTSTEAAYSPIAILGMPDPSISSASSGVLFIGDSITAGSTGSYYGNSYAQIAGKNFRRGIILAAISGEKGSTFAASFKSKYRMTLTQYATHAVIMYGTNDLNTSGGTAAQAQIDILTIANRLVQLGLKVYICTIPPLTTSTDAWATTVNQTPAARFETGSSSERGKLNAWVRTKPAPFTDYIEIADVIETVRDSGIWKAGYTTDGIHPNSATHSLMANKVNLWNMVTGLPIADTIAPSVPTGVTAVPTHLTVTLAWTGVTEGDLAGYNVYRNSVKQNGGLVTATNYSDTGLTDGVSYNYQVTSVDYAGNESAMSGVISSTPSIPPSFVYDSFTRANSTTSLGSTEGGTAGILAWTVLGGTGGINSNQGYFTTSVGSVAVTSSAVSDCNVEVKFPVVVTYSRIVFRATDANNYWIVQQNGANYELYKRSAGSFGSVLKTSSGITATANDVVKVVLLGSSIRVFVNGVERTEMAITDAFNATATLHGIATDATASRFDEFKVY